MSHDFLKQDRRAPGDKTTSMVILSAFIGALAIALLLPTISDALSVASLVHRRRPAAKPQLAQRPRFLFLIPAHNEALLIADTLRSLQRLDYPSAATHIVVIADNCTDDTAAIVRSAGIECLERHDPAAPGKPRAIAWALDRLRISDYDAMVIIDADTVVDAAFASGLASGAPLRDKAVQGYNGVSNPDENAVTRMAAVFADAKCRYAYGLKQRAGLNVPLRLGGCLGTAVLAKYGWQAFSIGEDWELYAQLTAWGVRIEGVDGARVFAQEARSLDQSAPQRQRWTAGKFVVLGRMIGPVLRSTHISLRQKLDVIAELSAPGPVVQLGVVAILMSLVLLLHVPAEIALVVLLMTGLVRHIVFATVALFAQPDPIRSAIAFLFLPVYGLWRVPIEFAAVRMLGDKPWIRTARHSSTEAISGSNSTGPAQ